MQKSLELPERVSNRDHIRLASYLMRHTGWHTAARITAKLNFSDRLIRSLASESNGMIVSSPGSPGYKHVYNCTGKEIAEIAGRLQAQAKNMSERAGQIRAQFHKSAKSL